MDAIVIRPADQADLAAIHALVERAYRGAPARGGWTHEADLLDGQRTDRAALEAILADPAHCLMVAVDADGAIIGSVDIANQGDGLSYLGMLSVDPRRQGGGLAKRLIATAEGVAQQRFGATTMEMTVIRQRAELIAYYQRRGYALTGEERSFPYGDERFGRPRRDDLAFVVLARLLGSAPEPG